MSTPRPAPLVPVSFGELVDKLTILDLKVERIHDAVRRAHAQAERAALQDALDAALPQPPAEVARLRAALHAVNAALWEVEDALREKERLADFGREFVELARSVYRHNDHRARLKLELNRVTGSAFVEVKSHLPMQAGP